MKPVLVGFILVLLAAVFAMCGLTLRLQRRLRQALAENDKQLAAARDLDQLRRARIIAEERQRIFGDLHDDIGAKLLDLIHTATTPEQADLARAALQDLRDVVSRSRGAPGTLLQVLGEVRAEAESRLAAGAIGLDWQQAPELPDPALDHGHALHLYRIVREAISNALKHARPQQLRIRVAALAADELLLDITDDGVAPVEAGSLQGQGTRTMRSRAEALQGSIDWQAGTVGGTKVVLRVPLPAASSSISPPKWGVVPVRR